MTVPKENETTRIHIWVRGRVQGVGFRAFAQQAGMALESQGWVRNVGYDKVETVRKVRVEAGKICGNDKKGPACRECG